MAGDSVRGGVTRNKALLMDMGLPERWWAARPVAGRAIDGADGEDHRLLVENAAIGGEERHVGIEELDGPGADAVDHDDLEALACAERRKIAESHVEAGDMESRHAARDCIDATFPGGRDGRTLVAIDAAHAMRPHTRQRHRFCGHRD